MKRHIRFATLVLTAAMAISVLSACGTATATGTPETGTEVGENTGNADTEVAENSDGTSETQSTENTEDPEDSGEKTEYAADGSDLLEELFDVTDSEAAKSVSGEDTTDTNDALSVIPEAEDPYADDPSVGALLNLLEGIYSAAPGAAGSSIRLEYAAKELLDFSETYCGNISDVYLTLNTNVWLNEKKDYGFTDIRSDFAECLAMVKECAETIAEDPSVPTPLAEDYDYTLQYDSYDTEKLDEICHYIGLATEVEDQ